MLFTTKDTKDTKVKRSQGSLNPKNATEIELKPRGGLSFVPLVSFVSFVFFVVAPQAASAQIYESVGIRAQGMSGAFVAVSDDATTTWWNPAGLASGGYLNGILEVDQVDNPAGPRARAFALS